MNSQHQSINGSGLGSEMTRGRFNPSYNGSHHNRYFAKNLFQINVYSWYIILVVVLLIVLLSSTDQFGSWESSYLRQYRAITCFRLFRRLASNLRFGAKILPIQTRILMWLNQIRCALISISLAPNIYHSDELFRSISHGMWNNLFFLFYGTSPYVSSIRKPDEILAIGAVILFK